MTAKPKSKIKSVLSPKMTKLLLRVRDHILAEPKRFAMSEWIKNPNEVENPPMCNTVACIGGWATILSAPRDVQKKLANMRNWTRTRAEKLLGIDETYNSGKNGAQVARAKLGLDLEQANSLFFVDQWPIMFQDLWNNTTPATFAHAGVAADRIMHFIATGE